MRLDRTDKYSLSEVHLEDVMAMTSVVNDCVPESCIENTIPMGNTEVVPSVNQTDRLTIYTRCSCVLNSLFSRLHRLLLLFFGTAYIVYLGFAISYSPTGAVFLCLSSPLVLYSIVNKLTAKRFSKVLGRAWKKTGRSLAFRKVVKRWIRRILTVLCTLGLVVFLVVDIWDSSDKWIALGGLAVLLLISILFSKHRTKINYTPVVWGVLIQFAMGLLLLRWPTGNSAFQWVAQQITILLAHTDKGSELIFGSKYLDHPVAFKILPVIIFFSALVSVLYYLGLMQIIIKCVAAVLEFTMATTPIEAFATASQIFIGQVESSVTLKPFFSDLTDSELHAVLTGGFATVAGTLIAAFAEFGVPVEHVIAASFMSAPAALSVAKLSFPETQTPRIRSRDDINISPGQESNLIEALSNGAISAIKQIAYIVVNLIAFVAILSFLDSIVAYLGSRVGHPEVSFQLICSYVFMPLSVLMGVNWGDARKVGALIGKKIMLSEFLAYSDLGEMMKSGEINERTAAISTYLLCGFGSVAAIGVNLGALTSAEPSKRQTVSQLIVRAMINGNIACFMTACVAGSLYQEPSSGTTSEHLANLTKRVVF